MSMKFRVELDVEIDRPIGEVFDYVANAENNPRWASEFSDVEKETEGPIREGTVFRMLLNPPTNLRGMMRGDEEQRSKGEPIPTTTKWREYNRPDRLVAESPPIKRGPGQIYTTQSFRFDALGEGATRLTAAWDREVTDVPFQRLASPFISWLIPREIRRAQVHNLQKLKALIEGGGQADETPPAGEAAVPR
jgi:Polyketide cyclase / dehydrase and lipid transport